LDYCCGNEGDEVFAADEKHCVYSQTESPFMEKEDLLLNYVLE
jgi:hypothetical protein